MLRAYAFTTFFADTESCKNTSERFIEIVYKCFVLDRVCGHESVILSESPFVRFFQPVEHDFGILGITMNRFFRIFDFIGCKRLNMLTESADVETFAFDFMRIEVVTRERVFYSPRWIMLNRKYFCSETFGNPLCIFLVFLFVKRARGIYENTSGLECFPNIHQNSALSFCAHFDVFETPFVARVFVFTEHTFSRARSVHKYAIEEVRRSFAEVFGFIERNDGITVSPFLYILTEDKESLSNDFVADKEPLLSEMLRNECRFATGGGAKVEHNAFLRDILVKHLLNKHRACFLHVVCTSVKEWVKCERNSFSEVVAVDMPRHFVDVAREIENVFFVVKAYRSNGFRVQDAEQLIGFRSESLSHSI